VNPGTYVRRAVRVALAAIILVAGGGDVGPRAAGAQATEPAFAAAAMEVAERLAAAFPKVEGLVVGTEAGRVILDLGASRGGRDGLELAVYRKGEEFKHPLTGQVLGAMDKEIGRIRIVRVQEQFALGEVIRLAPEFAPVPGDVVRSSGARVTVALPTVDPGDVKSASARSVTRDLAIALAKTGRFEVVDDRKVRATLAEEKVASPDQVTDPAALKVLAEKLKAVAVLLGKVGLLEKQISLDVEAISTLTGYSLALAGAEVKAVAPRFAAAPPPGPAGATAPRRAGAIQFARPTTPFAPPIRGPELSGTITALAVGDVDGDGRKELALSDGSRIYLYAFSGRGFQLIWQSPDTSGNNIIGLDIADVNGNAAGEIFVTNYFNEQLLSYVLEQRGNQMVRVWDRVPLFFRALPLGEGGKDQVLGQPRGMDRLFGGPINQVVWQGGRYVVGPALPVPGRFPLYGLAVADLEGPRSRNLLLVDGSDYLKVYDAAGKLKFTSGEHFGGTENFVRFGEEALRVKGGTGSSGAEKIDNVPIYSRIFVREGGGPGKQEIVVWRNIPSVGYFVKDARLYTKGKVFSLKWDGSGFLTNWESREFDGYISDYYVGAIGDGEEDVLIVALVRGLFGVRRTSNVLMYRVVQPEASGAG
jgi:hypothetical protein